MKKVRAICVVALAVIAAIMFPLGMISFIAADSGLTNVVLIDAGERQSFRVGADTVGGFLFEAGVDYGGYDRISHSQDALLWDGMEITVEREISFYVQLDGGETFNRRAGAGATAAMVISQLQQEIDIALIYNNDETVLVQNGDMFSFSTWLSRDEVEIVHIPYSTIRNHTNSVSRGMERLRNEGVDGEKAITTSIIYIGGVEDHREITNTEITEPVNAILDVGTAWLGSLTDVTAEDFHYFRRVRMEATAYTSGFGCTGKHPCDPWYGITASGRHVQHGIVAVDRNVIPLGTRLYVENYGFAIAADVGGAIRGNKIDLFMYDIADALRFGRRHIYVWILDEI